MFYIGSFQFPERFAVSCFTVELSVQLHPVGILHTLQLLIINLQNS